MLTDGSTAGMPWCATFVSWAAKSVGAPIGENGQGYASVADIEAWGRRTGRYVPVTEEPRPGDIVLYGTRHVVALSTLSLLIPAIGWFFAVQDPATPYWVLVLLALLAGLGGGNFSSFMPSTS